MTTLTSAELQLLRNQPHKTDLYLSIYRPNTTMTAVVSGTYDMGDTVISYTNPAGSYLNLYPDVTVLVGTTPGTDDQGRIRMRAASGTYAVFAENSINWQGGQYLTFLDYITLEAVYPKIIQDPSDAENVIFYKDNDIPYSNQNSIYGTFPCAGPHRAAFLSSGTASIYYSATGTYNVASQSLTYSWLFDGGTPTGSTSLTPGYVSYSQAGHYKTRLRITAANGAVDDTYRYVSIYDRPYAGTNNPVLRWELQDFSGSRDEGGYTASFKVFSNIGEIEPNALVVIFADTWYGGTKINFGESNAVGQSIVFVGYILSDTIKFNYKESYVEFKAGSVSEAMKNVEGFSVSCESKASPTTWFELSEMTVPKAMYHYLKWHSTTLKLTDFQYTGDDRLVQYFDADRGSLYDAVDSFMRDGMLGSVISDRKGKLWAEISPFGHEEPFDSIQAGNFTFHKQDWLGSPTIDERRNSDVSFVELGGIIYYGVSSNLYSAIISNAPSTVPLYHGKSDSPSQGLILTSQQQLNAVAGHYLAHHNTKFPNVMFSMVGNYANLDIAPLERMRAVVDQNDSVRGKSIQDLQYIVNSMEWSYNSKDQVFYPEVALQQMATGTAGQTVVMPEVPPDGGYGYPNNSLPPLPDFGGTSPTAPVPTVVVMHDSNFGFMYSTNFDSTNPTWVGWNTGLAGLAYEEADFMAICPNGAVYVGYVSSASNYFLARAPSVGAAFVPITLADRVWCAAINPLSSEQLAYLMTEGASKRLYLGSGGSFAATLLDAFPGYGGHDSMSYGSGRWLFTKLGGAATAFANGSAIDQITSHSIGPMHIRAGTTDITYHLHSGGGEFVKGTGNLTSSAIISDPTDPIEFADVSTHPISGDSDPTGNYIMVRSGVGGRTRSSDGGVTWSGIPNLPPGNYYFGYADPAGGSGKWIAASGGTLRYTINFGETWLNKEGNLLSISPTANPNMIRVVGVSG